MNKTYDVPMGTLYDLNKTMVLKDQKITQKDYKEKMQQIEEWFNQCLDGYAMLLCRERYDFTVFHLYEKANPNPPQIAVRELIDLLSYRGTVLSIEKDNNTMNNAWEIWIKIKNEAFVYYLFPCDEWVIEC